MKILIHAPSYDGIMRFETCMAIQRASRQTLKIDWRFTQGSFSTLIWNMVWCTALNSRKEGITHYAIIHADLFPDNYWLDKLLAIMEAENADVVSSVVAMKDDKGLTSTALDLGKDEYSPPRFTINQLAAMPKTFTHPKLLVNNGLMLVNLKAPWMEKVKYNNYNNILQDSSGTFYARSFSDDWFFSREVNRNGGKVVATTEINVVHVGQREFPSHGTWGEWDHDLVYGKAEL